MATPTAYATAKKLANAAIKKLKSDGVYFDALDALGIPAEPPGQGWRINRAGILWFREFVKNGGLVLDPNYWRLENNAEFVVAAAIEQALVSGSDASQASTRFIYDGPGNDVIQTQVNPSDYDKVTKLFLKLINLAHSS